LAKWYEAEWPRAGQEIEGKRYPLRIWVEGKAERNPDVAAMHQNVGERIQRTE
jgi:hypothetical protein